MFGRADARYGIPDFGFASDRQARRHEAGRARLCLAEGSIWYWEEGLMTLPRRQFLHLATGIEHAEH